MLPDISLEECIEMLGCWIREAMAKNELKSDFEYVIIAHQYRQIQKHLEAYRQMKEEQERPLHERLMKILKEVRKEI